MMGCDIDLFICNSIQQFLATLHFSLALHSRPRPYWFAPWGPNKTVSSSCRHDNYVQLTENKG